MNAVDLTVTEIDKNVSDLLGHDQAVKYMALPFRREGNHLWVAVAETQDISDVVENLSALTGMYIVLATAPMDEILLHIDKLYGSEALNVIASQFVVDERLKTHSPDAETLESISSAPAVRLLDSVIETSVLYRASDIHIEPLGNYFRIRYRIDGQLSTYREINNASISNIISRLKIMGNMDIAEKRRPQDGRFTMPALNGKIEFRLSTLPTINGEKAAIRLLYGQAEQLKKDQLGFFPEDLEILTTLFNQPHGAIFMTGPTGSGKSTTLTSFLIELNSPERNIVTVEDPVENPIAGVNHVSISPEEGIDFANALRYILRQDPNIIMIGEVRDEETAKIAIQAAMTGHVVLSTLHTNDAAGVIERLTDMGIRQYSVAMAISGIVSQRLVRRICRKCSAPDELLQSYAQVLGIPEDTKVYKGLGCAKCRGTGYKGRLAVYEYIAMNEATRHKIISQPVEFAAEFRSAENLKKNAVRNLMLGHTSVEEVMRVVGY